MKIYPNQLAGQLKQVAPVYLISGDEPLIVSESAHDIRQRILQSGNVERLRFNYDQEFSWDALFNHTQELSLFSPLKLIELSFNSAPDKAARDQLEQLLGELQSDICLLLTMPALKKNQQKQSWYQQIDQRGVIVSVYPPQGRQLQQWVRERLRRYQLQPEQALAERLIYYYEGNLLALNQTIEQLSLSYPNGTTELNEVEASLTQSGQFSQYQLVDAIWENDFARVQQIACQLKQEGEELTLFNWLMDKDLLVLSELKRGEAPANLWKRYKVFSKRQDLLSKAATRLSRQQLQQARYQLAQLDLAIKTQFNQGGDQEFNQLLLILSPQQWSFQDA